MPILFGVQASTLISITVCMIKNDRITALDPARNLAGLIMGEMRAISGIQFPERRHILVKNLNPELWTTSIDKRKIGIYSIIDGRQRRQE